ncbi:MAG: hypothetical protein RLN90_00590 [Balneolaceae bacterium]
MTKEDLLRTYLEDPILVQEGYLEEGEAGDFSWNDKRGIPIVELLKIIIQEHSSGKGENTIKGLANRYLDNKL